MWLFSLFPQQLHGVFSLSLSLSISASFILFAISFSVYSEFTLVKRRKIIPNFWETLPNKQRYLGHHKIGIVHNVSTLATVLLVSLQVMCTAYAVWYCTFSALIGFRFSLALFSASLVWFFVLFFSLAFFLHRRRSRRLRRHYFSCFARDYTLLKSSHILDKRELHKYGQKSNSWVPNYFWIHTLNRQVEKRWAIHWAELQWRVGFCLTIIHVCNWFQLSCAG